MSSTPVQSSAQERLTFTVFVAVLLHGLLVLGFDFGSDRNRQVSSTLDITLATSRADSAPRDAKFIAQHDQEGSGTEDDAKQMTTEQLAEFDHTDINDVREAKLANTQSEPNSSAVVTTQGASPTKTPQPTEQLRHTEQAIDGTAEDTVPVSQQIASLKAKLDKQREAYAQRPRVLRIKKIATKSSPEAKYLLRTIEKIEFVGTKNYPKEALDMGIQGWVRAAILLDSRGHVVQADILDSSGKKILDDSAIQLIYLAAPFAPFPQDIAANHDQMEIVRTFFFSIDGLRTGS